MTGKLSKNAPVTLSTSLLSNSSQLNDSLKLFWETGEIPQTHKRSSDDERVENHFKATHSRTQDGRYVVELPFKSADTVFDFENIRTLAVRRFLSLEKRLLNNTQLYN